MSSVLDPPVAPPFDDAAPTMAEGAEAWSQLCAALDEQARLQARIVGLAGRVARSGTIERIEGLTLDMALSLTHRLRRGDRSMLLTAADVLADMPATRGLFDDGVVSWSQVRGVVGESRGLTKTERALLDARVAASVDRVEKMDPDEFVDQVSVEVADLRDPRSAEHAEQRQARQNFLWGQPGMFDSGTLYGGLDNVSLAALLNNVDRAAPADDGRPLSQRRADGLLALVTHRCGAGQAAGHGEDDSGGLDDRDDCAEAHVAARSDGARAAAPADGCSAVARRSRGHPLLGRAHGDYVVLLDWRDVSINAAGVLQMNAPGCLPTVSAALLESLAAGGATVRAVLMDGARPLAVTPKVWAKELPRDVRLAVKARDRADRFPGSRKPIEHIHHFDKKHRGHHVDQLAGLSGTSHTRVHRHQWKISHDPASGEMTFTRGDRTWTTLPRGTRLRRPPPRGPNDDPVG